MAKKSTSKQLPGIAWERFIDEFGRERARAKRMQPKGAAKAAAEPDGSEEATESASGRKKK